MHSASLVPDFRQWGPGPRVSHEAETAGVLCDSKGWTWRPPWAALTAGQRPPDPDPDELSLGEWPHGWQYHTSNFIEIAAWEKPMSTHGPQAQPESGRASIVFQQPGLRHILMSASLTLKR